MTKLGAELLQSAGEALAIAEGRAAPARSYVPDDVDVKAIRRRTGLSQTAFATRFGLAVPTVRDWEQHRRSPDRVARVLLSVIARDPDVVARAVAPEAAE